MDAPPEQADLRIVTSSDYLTHIPYLLGAISNVLANGGSRVYRRGFGVGLAEWRLMWVLGYQGPLSASRASQIMGVDKAATSRALGGLDRRGLVTIEVDPTDTRQRTIELSEAGWALHSRIMVVSQERERRLFSAFSDAELQLLKDLLVRLLAHAPYVNDFDPTKTVQPGEVTSRSRRVMPRTRHGSKIVNSQP